MLLKVLLGVHHILKIMVFQRKKQMTEAQASLYEVVIQDLLQNPENMTVYAKRKCSVCSGKGYYSLDNMINAIAQFPISNNENTLCDCVKKNVVKEVKKRVQ